MKRKMLITLLVLVTIFCCALGFVACGGEKPGSSGNGQGTVQTPPEEKPNDTEKPSVVEVTGITLNKTTLLLEEGESEVLTATVSPSNATDKTVSWRISDPSVVMVVNGKVTAKKAGTTTITVIAGSKSAICEVTVTEKVIEVTSVSLNKTSLILEVGGYETLIANVLPSNIADKTVTWQSSNSLVATVVNGKVTALNAGTAIITATVGSKEATCTVVVNNKDFIGVVLDSQSFTYDGNEKRLTVQNIPTGAKVVYEGNGKIDAGIYTVSATVSMEGYNTKEFFATLTINKAVVNNITFTSTTYKYDGTEKAIGIKGILPDGVSVRYENNSKTNAGSYLVKAVFTVNDNYEEIRDMTATLKIERAVVERIAFNDLRTVYDGTKKFIEVRGNIPDEVTVEYIGNGKIVVGEYIVTAIFDCETDNYEIPDDMTAKLIIRKAVYDMAGISFDNKAFTYDGTEKSLNITGDLPDGVAVSYENNNKVNTGQYYVTAKFTGDSVNYYAIDEMQAIMTINKGTYDMSGTSFAGARFVYDGTPKSIYLTGELPDGVTVNYSGNGNINAGSYPVTASFISNNTNYNRLSDRSVTMIIDKAEYDMSEIKFENKSFIYDGTNKSIAITGSLPVGVTVAYYNNECVNAGSYTVTAKFIGDTVNYNLIEDKSAKITINKSVPYIEEVICTQTLNLYSTVELTAVTDIAGTISLDIGQTLKLGFNNYSWTFIPEDSLNYTEVTGQTGLTVCALVTYYDGESVFTSQNIIINNSAYMPESTPIKGDFKGLRYTFSHWSIEQSGTGFDYTTVITEDLNLYAVYDSEEIVYSIFYYNSADVENTNITQFTVSTQKNLYSIQRDYYIFDGWYDSDGAKVNKISAGTFGNLKLYAHWTPIEYAIIYNSKYIAQNSNPKTYNIESEFAFVAPVYDKYHIFEGWFANEDFTEEVASINEGSHVDITLYAKWRFTGTFISTASELKSVAYNMRGAYELTNDIAVTDADDWIKIGDNSNPFIGYFNGAGYSIKVSQVFGVNCGTVNNVNVIDGRLADYNFTEGSIYNCHTTSYLLMENWGNIEFCSGQNGFIAVNNKDGIIRNSYCIGGCMVRELTNNAVSGGKKVYIGGLVAQNDGLIENSYYDGVLNISYKFAADFSKRCSINSYYVGGLVGAGTGTIKNCYSEADISVTNRTGGNYVETGDNNSNIAEADVHVSIGVMAGKQNNIQNCYAVGNVSYWFDSFRPSNLLSKLQVYIDKSGFAECSNVINSFSSITYGRIYYSDTAYEKNDLTGVYGTNCYSSNNTNITNFMSRDFVLEKLTWNEYIDDEHISDGNVWILENGKYPKLWFED